MFALFTENTIQYRIFVWFFLVFLIVFVGNVHASESGHELAIDSTRVIYLVNLERTNNGLQALVESNLLDTVAEKKLKNMIENNYFAHTSPDGIDPWEWFFRSGYDFKYAGENLATKFKTAKKQHQAWMDSPTHKKNILDERFTSTGVAVGEEDIDGKKVLVTVQVFATPKKPIMRASNFTPETFVVPDELFLVEDSVKDVNIYQESIRKLSKTGILSAEDIGNSFLQKDSSSREIAWWIIGIITLFIIIVEYRIFNKKTEK